MAYSHPRVDVIRRRTLPATDERFPILTLRVELGQKSRKLMARRTPQQVRVASIRRLLERGETTDTGRVQRWSGGVRSGCEVRLG